MNKVQEFRNIVNKMSDTYEKKNSNYGDSFGKLFGELGAVSGLVPLYNKLHRATSLIQGDENHFESLEDTLIDMACYAIMNVIEMRNKKEKECKSAVEYVNVKEYNLSDDYFTPYKPYTTTPGNTWGGSMTYTSPCSICARKEQINGCDGCTHNIQLTCTATSNGGSNNG